jgi:DNA-binding FadR family transcriptional regulator
MAVNRATIRAALRAPQIAGFVEGRQGGGSDVVDDVRPRDSGLALPADVSPSALLEVRAIHDPRIASLAAHADRIKPEIDRLLAVMAYSGDPTNTEHRLMAAAIAEGDANVSRSRTHQTHAPVHGAH